MKRKKTSRKRTRPARQRPQRAKNVESHLAEMITVAWMLSFLSTLAAELGVVVTRIIGAARPNSELLAALNFIFAYISLLAGIVTLVLTCLTLVRRKVKPPAMITAFALVCGGLPLLFALLALANRVTIQLWHPPT